MAVQSHGEPHLTGAVLLEVKQRAGIDDGIGTDLQGQIVAAQLALVANAAADPPDCRVEEEERFNQRLHEVPKEVGAAHMRELMRQYNLKFFRTEQGYRRDGQQHYGTHRAYGDWTGDRIGKV